MTPPYTFEIPGRPKPKQRPRMSRRGKAYTPKATVEEERRIADLYDGPTFEGPVHVWLEYAADSTLVRVKSTTRGRHGLRSDLDNLVKLTVDGLQMAGAFANDRQVHAITAEFAP